MNKETYILNYPVAINTKKVTEFKVKITPHPDGTYFEMEVFVNEKTFLKHAVLSSEKATDIILPVVPYKEPNSFFKNNKS